jgi:hypothetical protein
MKDLMLLLPVERPIGFEYPHEFEYIVGLGLTNLTPWYVLSGNELRKVQAGLNARYPSRHLVPFARRQDNDDIACWQSDSNVDVYIIHDFASVGWEQRAHFGSFYAWLRQAIEDLIEFDT